MIWKMWRCEGCGFEVTDGWIQHDYEDVVWSNDGLQCPKCLCYLESYMYVTEGHLQVMGAAYINPIHSDSLALSPDQVAQHR